MDLSIIFKKTFIDEVDFYREELFCRPDDILIKFVSDLRQVGGFLQVLRFPPPFFPIQFFNFNPYV
jgi:hypothetical protein